MLFEAGLISGACRAILAPMSLSETDYVQLIMLLALLAVVIYGYRRGRW